MSRTTRIWLHLALILFAVLALVPFAFVINNSMRNNTEIYHSFFGLPEAFRGYSTAWFSRLRGDDAPVPVKLDDGEVRQAAPAEAMSIYKERAATGYRSAWRMIRPYMVNSLVVSLATAFGVLLLGSISAFVLSRYRFPGSKIVFFFVISTMMFPGVLTLVPSFLLVKQLGLLNTYWAMILPYVAGGQVFVIFILKSFFDGLPEDLFEAARIDGAGHFGQYRFIVLPLSKPIFSVVLVMNILGTWNNFLWPFVVTTDSSYHVVASGLYVLATSGNAQNIGTLFAAYVLSSVPLLVLFIYATRPFIQGLTSGAFKA